MNSLEFEKLVDKEKYQVFVFTSPCPFPISFARHTWFVLNKKGEIYRFEILHWKNKEGGYMYKNFTLPWNGVTMFYPYKKILWPSKLLTVTEGYENSTAERMIEVIENSKEKYSYLNRYFLTGPNSNTYTQWVLNQFPELRIKLPWNCIGKNYKEKSLLKIL